MRNKSRHEIRLPTGGASFFSRAALAAALCILGTIGGISASQAQSPMPCGLHKDVVAALAGGFDERAEAMGVTSSGDLLEIFASDEGETWTLVLTRTDGMSCLVFSGQNWMTAPRYTVRDSSLSDKHH